MRELPERVESYGRVSAYFSGAVCPAYVERVAARIHLAARDVL